MLLIILVAGATAAALLVNRQQRIDTVHEITELHQRLLSQEHTLWALNGDLAESIRPERVRRLQQRLGGTWVAIPSIPYDNRPVIRIALRDDHVPEEDLGG